MSWSLSGERPIYLQIIEIIQESIISNVYAPGTRLPSVRELAEQAGVNPNTMQKALSELEQTGIICTQRTSGRFVTEDENSINNLKQELAQKRATAFLQDMEALGLNREEINNALESVMRKECGDE